jgi:hypothetical protein
MWQTNRNTVSTLNLFRAHFSWQSINVRVSASECSVRKAFILIFFKKIRGTCPTDSKGSAVVESVFLEVFFGYDTVNVVLQESFHLDFFTSGSCVVQFRFRTAFKVP